MVIFLALPEVLNQGAGQQNKNGQGRQSPIDNESTLLMVIFWTCHGCRTTVATSA